MNQAATSTILTLFLLMIIGFVIKKRGHINASQESFIATFLQQYAIPGLMLDNVTSRFTPDFLKDSLPLLAVSFATLFVSILIGLMVAKTFRISPQNTGVFTTMFAFSNTIFIGVPVISGIFGEQGLPYLMVFYLMNTFLFWTMGVSLVAGKQAGKKSRLNIFKKLFNPPLIAFALGLVLLFTKTSLPAPVAKTCRYLSQLVTPLSTIYMGAIMGDLSFKKLPGLKPTFLVILGRFLVAPALAFALMSLLNFTGLARQVIVVAAALPVMAQVSVLAGYYGKDHQYTAFMTALTTLLSILIIPLYFRFI